MAPKKTAAPKAPKKAKQLGMGDGFDRKKIEEVEEAASNYLDARNRRMSMTVKEIDAQAVLDAVLEKHALRKYFFIDDEGDEEEVYVPEKKPKAKIRKVKQAKAKSDE